MILIPRARGAALLSIAGAATVAFGLVTTPAEAAPKRLTVTVDQLKNDARIPEEYTFCVPTEPGHTKQGANINPEIKWSQGPAGTKSYAVIVVDRDVPTVFTDANKEGKTIPTRMKRRNFYHMVMVDIPADRTEIARGSEANGPAVRPPGKTANGLTGENDYTEPGKPVHGSYDGPCPPWNDARLHHYHFIVYALNVPTLGLSGNFTGPEAVAAIAKHEIAKGEIVGIYTQNPKLIRKKAAS